VRTSRQLINEVETAVNQNGVAALVVRFGDGDQYLFTEHEELPVARLEDMRALGGRPIAIAVAKKTATGSVRTHARCLTETSADDRIRKVLPAIAREFGNHVRQHGLA
jgi:hypothetical protein